MKYLVIVAMPDGTTTQLDLETTTHLITTRLEGFLYFPLRTGENVFLTKDRIIQITEIEG